MEKENYMLISGDEIEKEKFNSQVFLTEDISKFLSYYLQILQYAYQEKVITILERNSIAELITIAIQNEVEDEEDFCDTATQIANYMYVITLWLMTMDNWEAWIKIKSVNSLSSATSFLHFARNWMLDELKKLSNELKQIEERVLAIRTQNVLNTYKILQKKVQTFETFDLAQTSLNLKSLHYCDGDYLNQYMFISDEKLVNSSNYLERLKKIIHSFNIEVGLLHKINANQLIKYKKNERKRAFQKHEEEFCKLEDEMKEKLSHLKKTYQKSLETAVDSLEAERAYEEKKAEIMEQWSNEEKKLEKKQILDIEMQGELISDNNSLQDLIKEYAIFSLSKKGEITYPSTLEKRGVMLSNISMKTAIAEFLENDIPMTEEEVEYLKKNM